MRGQKALSLIGSIARGANSQRAVEDANALLAMDDDDVDGDEAGGVDGGSDALDREPFVIVPDSSGEATANVPPATMPDVLRVVDAIAERPNVDDSLIAFLTESGRAKLWRLALASNGAQSAIDELALYPAGRYADELRRLFMDEWSAVMRLPIPGGYAYRVNGKPAPPLLMQRLIAHRVATRQGVGNWSAPGAGKTLSAILASRVIDARLTVVVAQKSTLMDTESGWAGEIRNAFPDSVVLLKERGPYAIDPARHTYILLNYEAFQQEDGDALVDRLIAAGCIDLIVLDEMHNAKHGDTAASKRHGVIRRFVEQARAANPDARVLGMTATPVINHLSEGVDLLETVTGDDFTHMDTKPTIDNAMALHEQFTLSCFRATPSYAQELVETFPHVDGSGLIGAIEMLHRGDVSGMERLHIEAKLPAIVERVTAGTVIYTQYVAGIIPPLRDAVTLAGWRVGVCTGQTTGNSETIAAFIAGDLDVLISSPVIREGLDGLQQRCDRLIVASLPWHNAGYQQLVGRVYRQGSRFNRIEVVIPQVEVDVAGESWSWDMYRKSIIDHKRTIGDVAVDGVLPEGATMSQKEMLDRSVEALRAIIARLKPAA